MANTNDNEVWVIEAITGHIDFKQVEINDLNNLLKYAKPHRASLTGIAHPNKYHYDDELI